MTKSNRLLNGRGNLYHTATLYIIDEKKIKSNWSRNVLTRAISNNRVEGRVNHGGDIHFRKVAIYKIKLVLAQQRGPQCLDLNIGKRFSNAPVTTSSERHVTELVLVGGTRFFQKSVKEAKKLPVECSQDSII